MTFFLIALVGCTTTTEGRRQLVLVSDERAAREGARTFQRIKNRHVLVEDAEQLKSLLCIVNHLIPSDSRLNGEWELALIHNDQPNAYALPGLKIAITSGLLRVAVNQDQLAAVLAHELAHIQAGHGSETLSQQVAIEGLSLVSNLAGRIEANLGNGAEVVSDTLRIGLYFPMSRIQEEEADLIGLELMQKAGFDPQEAIHFWRNMEVYGDVGADNFFSTHPSHNKRLAKIEQRIQQKNWLSPEEHPQGRSQPLCEATL